jgi:S1-C subfamily serine protease
MSQTFRMLHAASGTKGVERNGQFYFEDPRTVFRLGDDHKVMALFEWEGPAGPHKCEALWKDPSGKVVVVSDFQFAPPKSPFSGYFTLLVDDTAPTGIWTVEARIDGETAGSFSFEIVAAGSTVSPPPTRRIPLAVTDIYRQAQAATVLVEKLDPGGRMIGRGAGFSVGSVQIVTAFANIDGATSLRLVRLNGQAISTIQVLSWNRLQDWAVLKVEDSGLPVLKLAQSKSWNVGDRYYSLGTSAAGGWTIADGHIVGDTTHLGEGELLTLSNPFAATSMGGPVLNEFGDVVGILAEPLWPGRKGAGETSDLPPMAGSGAPAPSSALAVPMDSIRIPDAGATPTTTTDLAAKGVFIPLLQARDQVGFGALALTLEKKDGPAWVRDTREVFSQKVGQMIVFINWNPKTKFKGVVTLRFYDLDNEELARTKPLNINLRPGAFLSSSWTVPLATYSPGTYRVDAYLGDAPAWREYFRVIP